MRCSILSASNCHISPGANLPIKLHIGDLNHLNNDGQIITLASCSVKLCIDTVWVKYQNTCTMRVNETNQPNNGTANRYTYVKKAMRAGILTLSMLGAAAPASLARQQNNSLKQRAPREFIKARERQESHDIAQVTPVTARASIAYVHLPHQKPYYIDNPLFKTDRKSILGGTVTLIGYMDPTHKRSGPKVTFMEYNPHTMTLATNPADTMRSQVTFSVEFPESEAVHTYNEFLNDPANPATGVAYLDKSGEPISIGLKIL